MKTHKIRVLHFVKDDKFIDDALISFEKDGRFENECFIIVDDPEYHFKLIKNNSKIKRLYNSPMIKEELQRTDYDAIFFFSLTDYHIFKHIPKDKIVIWWAWGFDIYGPERFINIQLYKSLTINYLRNQNISLVDHIKRLLKKIPFVLCVRDGSRQKALKRIDYFQPVIHEEFRLMQKHKVFRAHEFYYPESRDFTSALLDEDMPNGGNSILIGNSATYTNNHLDVWERIRDYIPVGTFVHFPINYGIVDYANYISDSISSNTATINFIRDFLPIDEYYEILDSCSYAVFGVLREQAMGNVFRCLAKGIKVFFFRESILYKYFTDLGCVVFAIDDVDKTSFVTPLTKEQIIQNRLGLIKESKMIKDTREKAILEMQETLRKRKCE